MTSQPTRGKKTKTTTPKRKAYRRKSGKIKRHKNHPEYGTSKLEDKFVKEFLDKLGVVYERQYLAKDIKRYYDFKINERILCEVDGDFYHSYNLVYEEMNPMQKHNAWVDKIKNEWAIEHGFLLVRIWEHDINKHPEKVMNYLKEIIGINDKKMQILENKKKRH